MLNWRILVIFLAGITLWNRVGGAQDIRVYTRILAGDGTDPHIRSLMIFHAGKVYDYIEPAQEVTVFEPALKKFTVLNKPKQLRSELTQDQIRHYLNLAHGEASKQLDNPQINGRSLDLLKFQLRPSFTVNFDSDRSKLVLENPVLRYAVTTVTPESSEVVEKYLHVADWTAQCNSVLHPKSLLPGPRMAVNEELRRRRALPQSVELTLETEPPIQLTAQHEWTWNLQERDRQLIADWTSDLKNPSFRDVPFSKFQQEVLKSELSRRTASR